jgi:D-alanyl-D-alanine dipeptidase
MIPWDRSKGRPEPIRALNLIPEVDNGEPLVDLAEFAPSARILRETVIPYLRKSVAEMLERAAQRLPAGVYMGVIDAWRPIERQQRIFDFNWRMASEAFPNRDYRQLRRTVCRWVAPTDQKAPPGHCTGAAVDVWLVDDQNEALDVHSPYDRFQAARTYSFGLTEVARSNRELLISVMLSEGFSNCRDEWWHYSYGDAGWAVRMGKSECFYGLVTLNRELYEHSERLHADSFKDRPNHFLNAVQAPK